MVVLSFLFGKEFVHSNKKMAEEGAQVDISEMNFSIDSSNIGKKKFCWVCIISDTYSRFIWFFIHEVLTLC